MIRSIRFNKTYSVEPLFTCTNPRLKVKIYKLKPDDRGYRQGKREEEYHYIPLFKKGLTINFKPNLNVIVGTNGSGKSQLLKILNSLITGKPHKYDLDNIEFDYDRCTGGGFDFETDAIKNLIKPNPYKTEGYVDDLLAVMDSSIKSHGENTKILLNTLDEVTGEVLFLDEPENGLDLISQYKLIKKINSMAETNQVFVITHNKTLIESCDTIYDLDVNKWITPAELFKRLKRQCR